MVKIMNKKKIFLDGSAGTTGLRIRERLALRDDIQIITVPEEFRKDASARADAINSSDITFLCLPDDAARESASLAENENVVIIDTSTAHRTHPDWTYGFQEIAGRRDEVMNSKRIANPGCHASGFIALTAPLVENNVIAPDAELVCTSLTGYSGGGKIMIAEYESLGFGSGMQDYPQTIDRKTRLFEAPRMYGLSQSHKHLAEMVKVCGLEKTPVFCPIVAPFYSGMEVTVPLFRDRISADMDDICSIYADYYKKGLVHFDKGSDEAGFLSAAAFSGRDDMQICVKGNDERIVLTARFDNLGKGASGAAIQNMNIILGVDETTGLVF